MAHNESKPLDKVLREFRIESHDELKIITQTILERLVRLNKLIETVENINNEMVEVVEDDNTWRSVRREITKTAHRERLQLEKLYRKYSVKQQRISDGKFLHIHF